MTTPRSGNPTSGGDDVVRSTEEFHRRLRNLGSLVDVVRRFVEGDAGAPLFRQVLLSAMGAVGAGSGAVFRIDSTGDVRLLEAFGAWEDPIQKATLSPEPEFRTALEERRTVELLDGNGRSFWKPVVDELVPGLRARTAVHLRGPGEEYGFILLGGPVDGTAYDREHRSLLELISGLFRIASDQVALLPEGRRDVGVTGDADAGDLSGIEEMRRRYPPLRRCVGNSPAIREVLEDIVGVASTDCPVLFEGASGTGKELLARITHEIACGEDAPFEAVSCGAIPETLIESELFGHVAGAFTDATRDHQGVFERGRGGTVFLDEIVEMPPPVQVKLLRVLQERTFTPVGGEQRRRCDSRIVAATNRELREEVEAGRFREDLYYRLNVFPIRLPTLQERQRDIPLLVEHFLEHHARELGRSVLSIHPHAMRRLSVYSFPGNVRELRNVVRALLVEARDADEITDRHVVSVFSRHRVDEVSDADLDPTTPKPPGPEKPEDVGAWVLQELRRYRFNIALAERMLKRRKRDTAAPEIVPVVSRSGLTYYLQGEMLRALRREDWNPDRAAESVAGNEERLPRVQRKLRRMLRTAADAIEGADGDRESRIEALRRQFTKLPEEYDDALGAFADAYEDLDEMIRGGTEEAN